MSVFRNPSDPEQIVVTARPQALRHADGRHAGYHSGRGWDGLGKGVNDRALPLDEVYTPTNEPYVSLAMYTSGLQSLSLK